MTHWRRRPSVARRSPDQAGQSTVEFALMVPFLALMLLTVVQVGLLVRTRVLVTHAAREAARSAAVGGADGEVRSAALASADLDPRRLQVLVRRSGGRATVELTYVEATDVPVVGPLVGEAVFEARATMRLE
ncbi:MAG: pilus assembly protein [Acidimicrobiaceae bacterium]|nr:pilus assembly protein [Acidimicrobiaceae bacterium]MDE0664850.1 pilus assembly protein [Acidimicrobiaceae bacterium]